MSYKNSAIQDLEDFFPQDLMDNELERLVLSKYQSSVRPINLTIENFQFVSRILVLRSFLAPQLRSWEEIEQKLRSDNDWVQYILRTDKFSGSIPFDLKSLPDLDIILKQTTTSGILLGKYLLKLGRESQFVATKQQPQVPTVMALSCENVSMIAPYLPKETDLKTMISQLQTAQ